MYFSRLEPLDFTIRETTEYGFSNEGKKNLWVGNSGLFFGLVTPEVLEMHYLPEGSAGTNTVDRETSRKYAIVYCAALYCFLVWYRCSSLKIFKIKGTANEKMHRFLKKTLNQFSDLYIEKGSNWGGFKSEIEMERLVRDDELTLYFQRSYELCSSESFIMKV